MASKEWVEFNKKHVEVSSKLDKLSNTYRIECKCGWYINLNVNSGLPLGMKVAWWHHFNSLYPERISSSADESKNRLDVPNCDICEKPTEALIEKSWKSIEPEIFYKCIDHSKVYETYPGFKIMYLNKWRQSPWAVETKSIPMTQKRIDPEIAGSSQLKLQKKYSILTIQWVAGIVIVIAAGIGINKFSSGQEKKEAIQALEQRNTVASQCFAIKDEEIIASSGPVGSSTRNEKTIDFYEKILQSNCVEWGDGSIFNNPYFGINKSSPNWEPFMNAFNYTVNRWNGIEPFTLQCADGWSSPSIGKRGACSHHGGVVSPFIKNTNWHLVNQFKFAERLYPSLYEMQKGLE